MVVMKEKERYKEVFCITGISMHSQVILSKTSKTPFPHSHFLTKSEQWTDISSIIKDIYLSYLILIAFHGC